MIIKKYKRLCLYFYFLGIYKTCPILRVLLDRLFMDLILSTDVLNSLEMEYSVSFLFTVYFI